jgi:hypothetical protein
MKTFNDSAEWPTFKIIAFLGANALVLEAMRVILHAVI